MLQRTMYMHPNEFELTHALHGLFLRTMCHCVVEF